MMNDTHTITPIHPGEILRYDFLEPMGLSARGLARQIEVPANRITGILNGERRITAETALLLSKAFGMSETFWINLQAAYDLKTARANTASKLAQIKPLLPPTGD